MKVSFFSVYCFQNTLKIKAFVGRPSLHALQVPRPKETHPKLSVTWTSPEMNFDSSPTTLENKVHSRVCNVCRRSETLLNLIIVCSSCKVITLNTGNEQSLLYIQRVNHILSDNRWQSTSIVIEVSKILQAHGFVSSVKIYCHLKAGEYHLVQQNVAYVVAVLVHLGSQLMVNGSMPSVLK